MKSVYKVYKYYPNGTYNQYYFDTQDLAKAFVAKCRGNVDYNKFAFSIAKFDVIETLDEVVV